ncbi:MAG: transposase [Methanobrevibacter sp.]|jgi:hypothetical protein|nr:transposase [Candidatus Methanovirga aequatorialis]
MTYSLEMLLTIILTGAIDDIFQSRKLTRIIHRNVNYFYLSGNQTPDHSTISRFKNLYGDLIKYSFNMIIKMAKTESLLNLGRIAIDDSKYKANTCLNRHIVVNEDYLPEKALEKLFNMDKGDDEIYGDKTGEKLPENLKNQKQITEFIKNRVLEI